jgi:hypothetical protein
MLSCPTFPPPNSLINVDLSGEDDASSIDSDFTITASRFDLVKGVLKPIIHAESTFITDQYQGLPDEQLKDIKRQFEKELVPNLEKCGWSVMHEPYIVGI